MYLITRQHQGFTLIETILYTALFGFIISSTIFVAQQIFESQQHIHRIAQRAVEINFVIKKIEWLLQDTPSHNVAINPGQVLQLTKNGQEYHLYLLNGSIVLDINDTTHILTHPAVGIASLQFEMQKPTGVLITIVIQPGNITATSTHYVKTH